MASRTCASDVSETTRPTRQGGGDDHHLPQVAQNQGRRPPQRRPHLPLLRSPRLQHDHRPCHTQEQRRIRSLRQPRHCLPQMQLIQERQAKAEQAPVQQEDADTDTRHTIYNRPRHSMTQYPALSLVDIHPHFPTAKNFVRHVRCAGGVS